MRILLHWCFSPCKGIIYNWVSKQPWTGECDGLIQVEREMSNNLNKNWRVKPSPETEVKHIIGDCLFPFVYIWVSVNSILNLWYSWCLIVQFLVCEFQHLSTLSDWLTWLCWCSTCQFVSVCFALPFFKPADDACPLLSREWVAAVHCCVSSLLIMPVLCSPVCEWLLCLTESHACSWCLSYALQLLSDAVPCCVSSLLMLPVLCSPGCEWLLCLAVFQACWWCLSSALQLVSGCCALLRFKPADDAYPLLFRKWVAAVSCCVSSLQACWWCLPTSLQYESALHLFTWAKISFLYQITQIMLLPSIQTVRSPCSHLSMTYNIFLGSSLLCHSRDVHPTWVKSFTKTLSNEGSEVQGQSPKGALTVTDEK